MAPNRFDDLMRSFRQPRSRRSAVAAVLVGLLGPVMAGAADGKRGRGKGNNTNKNRKNRAQAEQILANCCSTGNCTPGKGKNLAKCCYEDGNVAGKNFSGANLGSANFTRADASDANFGGANLGKACLVDANLTDAKLNGSTNTGGAVFCRTMMPDGSLNDSGCNKGTRCCETCIAEEQPCGDDIGGSCCAGTTCLGGVCAVCDVCLNGCPFDTLGPAVDATADGGTIRICPGTYRTVGVILGKDLTIVGAGDGAGGTILDGELADRVLEINANSTVAIRDLTVTRGISLSFGGGGILVRNASTLNLERVQVTKGQVAAGGGGGGGIFVAEGSTLILRHSAVTDNTATGQSSGGGIYNFSGTVTLDASRVAGNVAGQDGGGIVNDFDDTVNLTNGSQVTGNRAQTGGGVYNRSQVTVSGGSAITGNTPDNCVDAAGGTGCPA